MSINLICNPLQLDAEDILGIPLMHCSILILRRDADRLTAVSTQQAQGRVEVVSAYATKNGILQGRTLPVSRGSAWPLLSVRAVHQRL